MMKGGGIKKDVDLKKYSMLHYAKVPVQPGIYF